MDAIVYDKVGKEAEKVREALYGIYPQETITDAAIASFDDGADGIPVKALTVDIEPVQDLHGYDHPWPAGGNQNIIPDGEDTNNGFVTGFYLKADGTMGSGSYNICEYFPVVAGESYTCAKYTDAAANVVAICFYDSDKQYLSGEAYNNRMSFTVVAPTNAAYARTVVDGATATDLHYFLVAKGTTAPAEWSPYSNICPISGWTGAEIQQTGVNVWDGEYLDNKYIDDSTGNISSSTGYRCTDYIPIVAGESYRIHTEQTGGRFGAWYDSDKHYLAGIAGAQYASPITAPEKAKYVALTIQAPSSGNSDTFSLNYPATDTEYHPYTGDQISVNWEDEAGTVYSGSATYNGDGTWNLIADSAIKTLVGTEYTWTVYGDALYRSDIMPDMIDTGNNRIPGICSAVGQYQYDPTQLDETFLRRTGNNSKGLEFRDVKTKWGLSEVTSEALNSKLVEMNSDGKPFQILYKIQPRSYTISTEQLLSTLYGTNNIWASTGNIEKLTYRADLGKYIDSHITTAVANALNA